MDGSESLPEEHRQQLRAQAEADAVDRLTREAGGTGEPSVDPLILAAPLPPPVFPDVVFDDYGVSLTIRLYHPFVIDGRRVSEVEILPPRFDHVEAMLEKRITRMALYASMCGLSETVLGALRWPDAGRVMAALAVAYPD